VSLPEGQGSPYGDALQWVARITTIGITMVVPIVVGQWLDHRWGTKFIGLIGILLGVSLGLFSLVSLAKRPRS
jgi:F0F1-type ATP synthase assembly protein I